MSQKLTDRVPTIEVAIKSRPHGENHIIINQRDFDPKLHTPWDEYLATKGKKAPVKPGPLEEQIAKAETIEALQALADEHKLVLPANISNVETAQGRLLAQLKK